MDGTTNLRLPCPAAAHAQKHVRRNEAIPTLDTIVHDQGLATPPATPANGNLYIAPAGAKGALAGQTSKVADYQNGAWELLELLRGSDRVGSRLGTCLSPGTPPRG
jgi:Protein of unknown function (DUF2793)